MCNNYIISGPNAHRGKTGTNAQSTSVDLQEVKNHSSGVTLQHSGVKPWPLESRDSSAFTALDMTDRLWVRVSAGAVEEFSSPGVSFCADSCCSIHSNPGLLQ